MSIKERVEKDFIQAYKNKDQSLDTLKMVKNAIKNAEIEKGDQLNDQEILVVLQREKKQRKEAISEFKRGNRNDLVQKENFELKIISNYLPKSLSGDKIKTEVIKIINQTKAHSMQDFGKVMGEVMKELKGNADGNIVSQIVKDELGKLN